MRALLLLLAALSLASCASAHEAPNTKRVALTFDDVPRHAGAFFTPDERTDRLIAELDRAGVDQVAFFVNPGRLDNPDGVGGEARIARYVAAGHVIANHSWSHQWASRVDADTYLADIDRASTWLAGRDGLRPWFRHPYLDRGGKDIAKRRAIAAGIEQRGLEIGYVTIDNYDWSLDALANDARRAGRDVDVPALCDIYAETMVDTSDFYDRIARRHLDRSPAHVILLHETDIAALCVADLVAAYRADGWEIVTADAAFADPIAGKDPDTLFAGSGRVAAIAAAAGDAPRGLVHPRTDEAELQRLFEERVMRGD